MKSIWRLDPLPDFLLDHTLSEDHPPARLREVVSRWVQFVGALWRWRNAAAFALRYTCDGSQTAVWFLAAAHDPAAQAGLADDVSVLLRAHGMSARTGITPEENVPFGSAIEAWPETTFAEVRQFETDRLWEVPIDNAKRAGFSQLVNGLPEDQRSRCRIPYCWWAPGGPFLLPLEKLVSYKAPSSITIYLEPTELKASERGYLSGMASLAQSCADQQRQTADQAAGTRKVDPAASLAGRILMANFRRLSDKPFLVSVQCAAPASQDAVRGLAGSIESIVYEAPFDRPQQEDDRLPSAASVTMMPDGIEQVARKRALFQYEHLRFAFSEAGPSIERLPYLVDARGACTVFRLPLNVRGGVPGVVVRQRPPDFHPGPRSEEPNGEVVIGRLYQGGLATVPIDSFCKHGLVTGFTGSGKTVTILNIVHQIRQAGIPVLIIESAKQEYRGLLGVPLFSSGPQPLWVFTVGDETCAPVRINPFELLPGVRVEAHISRLQTCFEAALPPIGPLSSMLGEALVDTYHRRGWRLTDFAPRIGDRMDLAFPTMPDFVRRMEEIVEERGYEGEVRSNVTAAVLGRLKPLSIGTKGLIFRDERPHTPGQIRQASVISQIFDRSTVLELNDLSIEDKALIVMFVLTLLREHRESQSSAHPLTLRHLTVVEEAHNVLENVQSTSSPDGGSADTRYKAVQAFSNMLSEVRALGEGLIIADQSPEKLAPDAMRNTNIQIAHQLRDSKDRDAMARAMIMDPEQRDFLGKLTPGQSALFVTGQQKATFVQSERYYPASPKATADSGQPREVLTEPTEQYRGLGFRSFGGREVRAAMAGWVDSYRTGPFDVACEPCRVRSSCPYREPMLRSLATGTIVADFVQRAADYRDTGSKSRELRGAMVRLTISACSEVNPVTPDAVWCAFVHLWHRDPGCEGVVQFPAASRDIVLEDAQVLGVQ